MLGSTQSHRAEKMVPSMTPASGRLAPALPRETPETTLKCRDRSRGLWEVQALGTLGWLGTKWGILSTFCAQTLPVMVSLRCYREAGVRSNQRFWKPLEVSGNLWKLLEAPGSFWKKTTPPLPLPGFALSPQALTPTSWQQ